MGNPASHTAERGLWSRNSPDKSELSKRMGRRTMGLEEDPGYKESFLQNLEYHKELTRKLQDSLKAAAFKAALREHLEEHPEMAADQEKMEMLRYCLYTYCRIHPDFAGFTPKARVQEAGRMACQFLNQLNGYLKERLR